MCTEVAQFNALDDCMHGTYCAVHCVEDQRVQYDNCSFNMLDMSMYNIILPV